ncbi:MAG TPA: PASTA domain-containing protein, partial [Kofleriaceae bacterium]
MKRVALILMVAACQMQSGSSTFPNGGGAPPARAYGEGQHDEVVVPKTKGKSVEDATAILRAAGITGEIHTTSDGGFVCETTPGAGNTTLGHLGFTLYLCDA